MSHDCVTVTVTHVMLSLCFVIFITIIYNVMSYFLAKSKEENKKTKLWKKREIIKD